jgi:hypothetical protein
MPSDSEWRSCLSLICVTIHGVKQISTDWFNSIIDWSKSSWMYLWRTVEFHCKKSFSSHKKLTYSFIYSKIVNRKCIRICMTIVFAHFEAARVTWFAFLFVYHAERRRKKINETRVSMKIRKRIEMRKNKKKINHLITNIWNELFLFIPFDPLVYWKSNNLCQV